MQAGVLVCAMEDGEGACGAAPGAGSRLCGSEGAKLDGILESGGIVCCKINFNLQADVLVCSRGGGRMLKERMGLARELWAAGLRALFLQAANPHMKDHYEFASAHHIPWLAVLEKSTFAAAETVKVCQTPPPPPAPQPRCYHFVSACKVPFILGKAALQEQGQSQQDLGYSRPQSTPWTHMYTSNLYPNYPHPVPMLCWPTYPHSIIFGQNALLEISSLHFQTWR